MVVRITCYPTHRPHFRFLLVSCGIECMESVKKWKIGNSSGFEFIYHLNEQFSYCVECGWTEVFGYCPSFKTGGKGACELQNGYRCFQYDLCTYNSFSWWNRKSMVWMWLMIRRNMRICTISFPCSCRNITDTATNDLLGGLCPHCYRMLSECKCDERKPITEINRSGR